MRDDGRTVEWSKKVVVYFTPCTVLETSSTTGALQRGHALRRDKYTSHSHAVGQSARPPSADVALRRFEPLSLTPTGAQPTEVPPARAAALPQAWLAEAAVPPPPSCPQPPPLAQSPRRGKERREKNPGLARRQDCSLAAPPKTSLERTEDKLKRKPRCSGGPAQAVLRMARPAARCILI